MTARSRVSATVDANLIAAIRDAVDAGQAQSISAWVAAAMRLKLEHDGRLRGMGDFIAAHEAERGEVTSEEMEAAHRAAKARAVVVRDGEIASNGRGGAP